jgi:hypothetical protein
VAEAAAYVRRLSAGQGRRLRHQDGGFQPVAVDRLHGCFANVMGMPLCHVARAMRRLGYPAPADIPAACRAHTGYDCPVYESILGETA